MNWKQYKRKGVSEMREYVVGENVSGISISDADKLNGSPKEGDMIARNPKNHDDQWLVAKKYFEDNFERVYNTNSSELASNIKFDERLRVKGTIGIIG